MKKFVLAAAVSAMASTAFAGNLDPVVVTPVEIVEDVNGSSSGILLPLLLLAIVVAAVAD